MAKKVTMTDIAKECGVSQTLVSFVLNGVTNKGISEETQKKVTAAAQKLGYFAGKPLFAAGNSNPAIFFLCDSYNDVCSKVFTALSEHLSESETELVHLGAAQGKKVKKIAEKLQKNIQRIQQIVYVADTSEKSSGFLSELAKTPQISEKLFLIARGNIQNAKVRLCDFSLSEAATTYMNELGYTSIAYLSESKNSGYDGYLSCVEKLKMRDYSVNIEEALNFRRRFDAIVVQGCALAVKLYLYFSANKLLDFDKIPVICTGDDALCETLPVSLTTVDFDYDALAKAIIKNSTPGDIVEIALRDSHEPQNSANSFGSDSVWLL